MDRGFRRGDGWRGGGLPCWPSPPHPSRGADEVIFTTVDPAMTAGKSLCLNMIVKNETANLERCLGALADHVTCWVIGDTGSTDGTQAMVKSFFAARNLPGELHEFPFENFEQARN